MDMYVFEVNKSELPNNYQRVDRFISFLEKTPIENKGKVFIIFNGYDDIPAEIYEIDEIRKWV